MNIEVTDKHVTITLDRITPPRLSKSGKSHLIATTSGNVKTDETVDGKVLTIGCTAYIPA